MSHSFDRLLGRTERRDAAPRGTCPEPDVLAAYMDDGLTPPERASVEAHAADCAQCALQLAAIVRLEDESGDTRHARATRFRSWARVRWVVPAATAAILVVIYVALPGPPPRPSTSREPGQAAVPSGVAEAPPPAPAEARKSDSAVPQGSPAAPAAPSQVLQQPERDAARSRDAIRSRPDASRPAAEATAKSSAGERAGFVARSPLSEEAKRLEQASIAAKAEEVAPLAVPPPAAAAPSSNTAISPPAPPAALPASDASTSAPSLARRTAGAPVVIHSPRADVQWRVTATAIERSADAGRTWSAERPIPSAGAIMGVAPTADSCWIAWPSGLVLRRTATGEWLDVSPAPRIPIARIESTGALDATLVTPDGAARMTSDGGKTWTSAARARD